jgi:predicted permease
MSRLRRCVLRVYSLVRPARSEADADRELRSHLTLLEDEFQSRGLTPNEARLAARRAFGGVAQAKESHRDARSFVWVADAGRDLRHGARILRRDLVFTLTAALSLAIGIGATTTIVTLANALFFRPAMGVTDSPRLVDIGSNQGRGGFGPSSYPNYLDVRQRTTTLSTTYAYSRLPRAMSVLSTETGTRAEIFGTFVTTNYFTGLGVIPAAGRLFDAGDSEQPGASPIVVLSYRGWTRRFNQDPAIVGRRLTLDGMPFTIVGVASDGFQGTGIRASDVWVPVGMAATATAQGTAALTNRTATWLLIGGRLKPGIALSRAAAEMDVIGQALEREHPDQNRGAGLRLLGASPLPGNNAPVIAFLGLLMLIVSLVLAVTCANVAGVLLARATARRQEVAVRLTMGAGRGRLVRQLLTETLLLFVLGGAAGLWLARSAMSLLSSYVLASSFGLDVPLVFDVRVIAFTTSLTLVAALLAGLAPALQGSKADVASALKVDTPAPARLRLRHLLLAAQVAFSLLLVVMAGLCGRALQHAGSVDPGFDPHGVETASIDLRQAGYTDETGPLFARELVDRVRRLPDVRDAAVAAVVPGGFETRRQALGVPGVSPPNDQRFFGVDWNVIEPAYFSTLRIPLMAGRDFRAADRGGAPLVAIVSEGAAAQFWPGQPTQAAIGRSLVQPVFGLNGDTGERRTLLVVGVADEVKSTSVIDGLARACVYVPLQQAYTPRITVVARTTHGQRIVNELRTLLTSMNPNLSIATAQTLEDSLAFGLTPQRVVLWVSGSFGLVGLLLAALGIYGVTAYIVTRRTREIGIRIALGAQRTHVIRMILRQGMAPVAVGSVVGLLLAAASSRVLTAYLFGIPPVDPVAFSGVAVLFLFIALAACYMPVRRATRINSMEALRYE